MSDVAQESIKPTKTPKITSPIHPPLTGDEKIQTETRIDDLLKKRAEARKDGSIKSRAIMNDIATKNEANTPFDTASPQVETARFHNTLGKDERLDLNTRTSAILNARADEFNTGTPSERQKIQSIGTGDEVNDQPDTPSLKLSKKAAQQEEDRVKAILEARKAVLSQASPEQRATIQSIGNDHETEITPNPPSLNKPSTTFQSNMTDIESQAIGSNLDRILDQRAQAVNDAHPAAKAAMLDISRGTEINEHTNNLYDRLVSIKNSFIARFKQKPPKPKVA